MQQIKVAIASPMNQSKNQFGFLVPRPRETRP
jgi:hypothetical protein